MTKTEFVSAIVNANPKFTKSDVQTILDSISEILTSELKTNGVAVIPGIVKLKAVKKAPTKERQGINPFTKQTITIPAKPASTKVKASVQKVLKDAVL